MINFNNTYYTTYDPKGRDIISFKDTGGKVVTIQDIELRLPIHSKSVDPDNKDQSDIVLSVIGSNVSIRLDKNIIDQLLPFLLQYSKTGRLLSPVQHEQLYLVRLN